MKPADCFYLVLAPVLLSVGQVLFKKTADGVAAHSLSRFLPLTVWFQAIHLMI